MVDARASRFKVRGSRLLSTEGSSTRPKKDPSLRSGRALNLELFLFIRPLPLLDMHKAEILHQRPVVMNQETSGTIAGVEMLVPAKNRNTEHISVAPVVAPIFDETVTPAGDDVIYLFVHVAVCARTLSRRNLGQERSENPHQKACFWIDHIAHPSHRCLLECNAGAVDQDAAGAPPLLFATGKN